MICLTPNTSILAASNQSSVPHGNKVSLGKTEASVGIAGVALPAWTPWASQQISTYSVTVQEHSSEEDRLGTSSLGPKYSSRRREMMNTQRRWFQIIVDTKR